MVTTTPATEYHSPTTQFLRRDISEADEGLGELTVGVLPARAIVISAGVVVSTAFNGTTPIVDIGTSDDPDDFATDLALATAGRIVADEMATANNIYSTTEETVTCTVSATGNDSTAGYGSVYVEFIPYNGLGRSS
jgi:hypothetical protein